jgi:hypothetical protein
MITNIILVVALLLFMGSLIVFEKINNRLPKEIIECNKDNNCAVIIRNFEDGKVIRESLVEFSQGEK